MTFTPLKTFNGYNYCQLCDTPHKELNLLTIHGQILAICNLCLHRHHISQQAKQDGLI